MCFLARCQPPERGVKIERALVLNRYIFPPGVGFPSLAPLAFPRWVWRRLVRRAAPGLFPRPASSARRAPGCGCLPPPPLPGLRLWRPFRPARPGIFAGFSLFVPSPPRGVGSPWGILSLWFALLLPSPPLGFLRFSSLVRSRAVSSPPSPRSRRRSRRPRRPLVVLAPRSPRSSRPALGSPLASSGSLSRSSRARPFRVGAGSSAFVRSCSSGASSSLVRSSFGASPGVALVGAPRPVRAVLLPVSPGCRRVLAFGLRSRPRSSLRPWSLLGCGPLVVAPSSGLPSGRLRVPSSLRSGWCALDFAWSPFAGVVSSRRVRARRLGRVVALVRLPVVLLPAVLAVSVLPALRWGGCRRAVRARVALRVPRGVRSLCGRRRRRVAVLRRPVASVLGGRPRPVLRSVSLLPVRSRARSGAGALPVVRFVVRRPSCSRPSPRSRCWRRWSSRRFRGVVLISGRRRRGSLLAPLRRLSVVPRRPLGAPPRRRRPSAVAPAPAGGRPPAAAPPPAPPRPPARPGVPPPRPARSRGGNAGWQRGVAKDTPRLAKETVWQSRTDRSPSWVGKAAQKGTQTHARHNTRFR